MKTIHKYPLGLTARVRIWIPGYRPVSAAKDVRTIALQHKRPCLWVGVDTDKPKVAYVVTMVGTGHDVDADVPHFAVYLGSVLLYDDKLVLHAFLHEDPDQTPDEDEA